MSDRGSHRFINAAAARGSIARLLLDRDESSRVRLGTIQLEPHQVSAASRIREAIREFGGAILCDPVGTGKTYSALSIGADYASVLVVAPAVLRDMWQRAASLARVNVEFISFEALSRASKIASAFGLLIVDEAHNVRNAATHRYAMLSRLASHADVVLLTATPIHNRTADLTALLSLFLGERGATLSSAELGRCVIRREATLDLLEGLPKAQPLVWCPVREDERLPRLLLSLPPPLPPRDGGDGGVLVVHSLVRQWASSDAALRGGIRRRLLRAEALIAALDDGTWPTKSELASWISGDDAVQLGFSALLASPASGMSELLDVIRVHREALQEILVLVSADQSRDIERAEIIRSIRSTHPNRPVVAFSQYADTVNAMFRILSRDGMAAVLTGRAARVAGGAITRSDAIGRFAPHASGRAAARRAESVSLLLATDLLSEGVNLQDAGVVIHLDLPWTPARMEQRLGRIARMGSQYDRVLSYAIRPPASAEEIIRMENILEAKARAAGLVTSRFSSLPASPTIQKRSVRNEPHLTESIRELLNCWADTSCVTELGTVATAAVASPIEGFLAACIISNRPRLIAGLEERISDDPELVLQCMRYCNGHDVEPFEARVRELDARILSWIEATDALAAVAQTSSRVRRPRLSVLRQIDRILRRSPRHERSSIGKLAVRARGVLRGNLSAGIELELESICRLDSAIEPAVWLSRVIALGSSRASARAQDETRDCRIAVLIVLTNVNALMPAKER